MITVHPSDSARNTVDDLRVLDFDMLQTGHSDRGSIPNTIRLAPIPGLVPNVRRAFPDGSRSRCIDRPLGELGRMGLGPAGRTPGDCLIALFEQQTLAHTRHAVDDPKVLFLQTHWRSAAERQ